MTKVLLPVGGEPLLAQRQYPRGQIGNMVFRKDQLTAVIGNKLKAIILIEKVPADPAISCPTLPGWGLKAQKSNPLILPGGDIP